MARPRTGHIFRRNARYYVTWRVEGKSFTRALHDESGQPVKTRRQAEAARDKVMQPFTVGHEAEILEAVGERLAGRKAELARLEAEQSPALEISQAWETFARALNRPDSGEATLSGYSSQWFRFQRWMKETHPSVLTLREVTKSIAESYAQDLLANGLSSNSFNKHTSLLRLIFRTLTEKARLDSNPWEPIQSKKLNTHSRRELTVEELQKVCTEAEGELRVLLTIGCFTGLRLKDSALLRWAETDLTRGIIAKIPAKTARRKPIAVQIPIHPALRAILANVPRNSPFVMPDIATKYLSRNDIVTDLVQRHLLHCGISLYAPGTGPGTGKKAVVEAGYHSLRHSFVSLCRNAGVAMSVVQSLVGHYTVGMTMHYSHVGAETAAAAVATLPDVLGTTQALPAPPPPAEADPMPGIVATLESMTTDNWQARRDDLLARLRPLVQSVMVEL